jgi:predicted ATP-grasp superfamily ATP-dependent carboligase
MLDHLPAVIVQEWIEGPDSEIFFTFFCTRRDGTPAVFFSGRKLHSDPPGVGSTAICIPAPDFAETLERETRKLLERIRYRGLGSLEFKRDVRNGRILMVEPTVGRTDWQEEIAALGGVNLPVLGYWIALGADPPSASSTAPQRCPAWRADFRFKLPAGFPANIRMFDAHFRWSDPLPGVYYYLHEQGFRRVWRRLQRYQHMISKAQQRPL